MKQLIPLIVVSILLAACVPQATAIPTATASLTATSAPTKTPTPIPTETPDPAQVATQSAQADLEQVVATPSAGDEGGEGHEVTQTSPNTLTYKNAEGQEVTVELGMHEYTNPSGEVLEVVEPPDEFAALKFIADRAKWYPAITDQREALDSMFYDQDLQSFIAQYGIPWPPKDRRSWVSVYPLSGGYPFMTLFVTGWEGGTLVVGQQDNGDYFCLFSPLTPDVLKNKLLFMMVLPKITI